MLTFSTWVTLEVIVSSLPRRTVSFSTEMIQYGVNEQEKLPSILHSTKYIAREILLQIFGIRLKAKSALNSEL
jgi:hypothetical protein